MSNLLTHSLKDIDLPYRAGLTQFVDSLSDQTPRFLIKEEILRNDCCISSCLCPVPQLLPHFQLITHCNYRTL